MGYISGFLPFTGLALTILYRRQFSGRSARPFEALCTGSLIWGAALALVTNILSFFSLLFFPFILAFWIAYNLFFGYLALNAVPKPSPPRFSFEFAVIIAVCALTFLTAALYPPNTWDSMTYHMPKVMHWWQNHSLAHYYTWIPRQTAVAPFPEIIIFHSYALARSDFLANYAQWAAFAGLICLAYATAAELGAGKRGRLLAALFCATLPMGVLQATGTQTDLVVAFWLMCMGNRFLVWRKKASLERALAFGAALGLALFSKGTACVIAPPFVIAFAWFSIKKPRTMLFDAVLAGLLALALFAPHFARNYIAYSDLTYSNNDNLVPKPNLRTFAASLAGNALVNSPPLVSDKVTDEHYQKLLSRLGLRLDDTKLFPWGTELSPRTENRLSHDDWTPNPVHLALLMISFVGILLGENEAGKKYLYYLIESAALFCFLLTIQPWLARLQVPLFALAAPLFGLYAGELGFAALRKGAALLLALSCVHPLFHGFPRTLLAPPEQWKLPRAELAFVHPPKDFKEPYIGAVDALARENPRQIGLLLGEDSWEYPLWTLLKDRLPALPRIEHVADPESGFRVRGPAPFWPAGGGEPEYYFVLGRQPSWEKEKVDLKRPRVYRRTEQGMVRLY